MKHIKSEETATQVQQEQAGEEGWGKDRNKDSRAPKQRKKPSEKDRKITSKLNNAIISSQFEDLFQ